MMACVSNLALHLFLWIKFYQITTTSIYLCVVDSYFHATVAELNSCDGGPYGLESLKYLLVALCKKGLPTLL